MQKKYLLQFLLVVLGTALYFLANIQRVAVPGAIFDVLQSELNANAAAITGLGASFMYIYALGQLIAGVLIARWGGFRIITAGCIIFSIGCLLFPFASSLPLLYLSRALVGFGSATFYLSIVQEIRRIVHKNNYSLALSLVLFISYTGGIIANAPFVLFVNKMGLKGSFISLGAIALIISVLYLILKCFMPSQKVDKTVHFNLDLYKSVLKKIPNINIFIFAGLNYGLYYILQTAIGKKFLEDFCRMPTIKAAVILSLMSGIYAISGPLIAAMSKASLNRRAVFMKFSAFNTFIILLITILCIIFDYKTPIIALLFCFMTFWASLSPILISLLHDTNQKREASVAVALMTSGFYFVVGILGNVTGCILTAHTSNTAKQGIIIYSNAAYLTLFISMLILSLISLSAALKIKESPQTLRYIKMCNLMLKHKNHEHEIYSRIGH